jgi:hypothetical protein
MVRHLVIACCLLIAAANAGRAAELIDRVIAVVNGSVITQSDLRAALRLGLVDVSVPAEVGRAVGERLIERRLMLTEVNRYGPPEPADALIDARVQELRNRFASEAELQRTLDEVGLTMEQVRAHVRDDLRIASYLQQRFAGASSPSEADLLSYYRDHQQQFTRGGVLLTYSEAVPDVRAALLAERRATQIRDWVAGLRRRADITIPAVVRR